MVGPGDHPPITQGSPGDHIAVRPRDLRVQLTVLGGIDLRDAQGQRLDAVVQQPKRLALLTYLALTESSALRSRDTILALFWPDATMDRARRALNQSLHFLRQQLGQDAILSVGPATVGLAANAIWCDAAAFDDACARGELSDALSLYRGDLLPGFFVDAGPEFEHWLDEARTRLKRAAARVAWDLGDDALRNRQFGSAAAFAHRAAEISGGEEASIFRLMQLLDRAGDGSGALDAYDALVRHLARDDGATPSLHTRELAADIRIRARMHHGGSERGVTLPPADMPESHSTAEPHPSVARTSDIVEIQPDPGPTGAGTAPAALPDELHPSRDELRKRRRSRRLVIGVALAAVIGAFGMQRWLDHADHDSAGSARATVIVEPFASIELNDPRSLTLSGSALTSAIVDPLSEGSTLHVLIAEHNSAVHRQASPSEGRGIRLRVSGNVAHSGDHVRVSLRLTDDSSGRVVRNRTFEGSVDQWLDPENSLGRHVSAFIRTVAGHEQRLHEWSAAIGNEHAYTLMQMADASRDIAEQLEQAGNSAAAIRALRGADSVLSEAESLAPNRPEPKIERAVGFERLAFLSLVSRPSDIVATERLLRSGLDEARRAVVLDRRNAAALEAAGSLAYWYWLVVPLSPDSGSRVLTRAEQDLRAAVAVNPGRAESWSRLSLALYARADYVGAYLAGDRAYRADAYLQNSQEILSGLAIDAYEIGNNTDARRWCGELRHRFERSWTAAYCELSLLAWMGPEHVPGSRGTEIARAWAIASDSEWSTIPAQGIARHLNMLVAAILARNGLRDSAEAVIRRAKSGGDGDPELVPLEAHARLLLGQDSVATDLLMSYFAARPGHRTGVVRSRRFASLTALQQRLTRDGVPARSTAARP